MPPREGREGGEAGHAAKQESSFRQSPCRGRQPLQGTLGCNLPRRAGSEQESWAFVAHDLQSVKDQPEECQLPHSSCSFRFLETKTRGRRRMGTRKRQKVVGCRCGLNGAGTLSPPVISSVHKTPLFLFLLRAHEQSSSPGDRVQETPRSISQRFL